MAELVTVTGSFEYPDDSNPRCGFMQWLMLPGDIPDLSEPSVVLSGPVTVPINGDGEFSVTLRATDDPELTANVDGPIVYLVRRISSRHDRQWFVTVPLPGPWDWTELSPSPSSDAVVVPVIGPQGEKGDTGDPSTIPGPKGDKGDTGETGPPGPPLNWLRVTQAEYNDLVPDPEILYVIIG